MTPTFSDLALATYCARKLYYRRRDDDFDPPPEVTTVRDLAFRYETLLDPSTDLHDAPIAVSPAQFRSNLGRAMARLSEWDALADPPGRDVLLEGRHCRGVAHKVLDEPPVPSIVSPGDPPPEGVWRPQSVKAVAAAKALAWERETPVESAFVEYPAHGIIREVRISIRRRAEYRRALRVVRSIDGPPPRVRNRSKCRDCEYRGECGVKTRTLGSLL